MTDTKVNHHTLPTGTVLFFTSTKGSVFRVKLCNGVFEKHSRHIEALETPIVRGSIEEPKIMCVVPPKTRVAVMAHAYEAAIHTVSPGDTVYLLDPSLTGHVLLAFKVQSVRVV